MRILGRCLFVALLLTLGVAAPAHATFPGDNGRISFQRFTETEESAELAIFTAAQTGSEPGGSRASAPTRSRGGRTGRPMASDWPSKATDRKSDRRRSGPSRPTARERVG